MNRLLTLACLASTAALGLAPLPAHAQEAQGFRIWDHNVGEQAEPRRFQGLWVTIEIQRAGLNIGGNERSEICATFENTSSEDWTGGYRLSDREVYDTHASLRVPAYGETRRCETLNPQSDYTVVLRQDQR